MQFRDFYNSETGEWNLKEMRAHFKDVCNSFGIWSDMDEYCDAWGLSLVASKYYDNRLEVKIVSPKFDIGMDIYNDTTVHPTIEEDLNKDLDELIKKAIDHSNLFKDSEYEHVNERARKGRQFLLMQNNPNPGDTFVANMYALRKQLRLAFKTDKCKFIDFSEQYDIYGESLFDVWSDSKDYTILFIGSESDEELATFAFDKNLNFTVEAANGAKGNGTGYEDAAMWYVLNVANKLATGEYAKDYDPNTYQLIVYLNQDFYTRNSRNIWEPIQSIFEDNGRRETGADPEDWVDDRAAAWTCVEEEDVKEAVAWLRKRRTKNPTKFEIIDKKTNKDVTDQF